MPDQSSAADEHALLQEITAPLSSLPDDPVPQVADTEFPIVLRGYDRIAVDAYVRKTSQLVAELQATRSPEAAVRRALERVGDEVSSILQRAHDTAEQITAQSRREAEDRLEVARAEAASIVTGAQVRVKELDAETDRIWAERRRIVDDTHELASQLESLAVSARDRFPAAETGEHEPVIGGEIEPASSVFPEPDVFTPSSVFTESEVFTEPDADAELEPGPDEEATTLLPGIDEDVEPHAGELDDADPHP